MREDLQEGVMLTYLQQSGDTHANTDGGDQYTGLDRFGRVIDQNWVALSGGTTLDRTQNTFDRNGNVLTESNLVNASEDESFTYDDLDRLTAGMIAGAPGGVSAGAAAVAAGELTAGRVIAISVVANGTTNAVATGIQTHGNPLQIAISTVLGVLGGLGGGIPLSEAMDPVFNNLAFKDRDKRWAKEVEELHNEIANLRNDIAQRNDNSR